MGSKIKVGLILSCIGGAIYLLLGIVVFIMPYHGTKYIYTSLLIIGIVALVGTIFGIINAKAGGAIVLSSVPISIVYTVIAFESNYYTNILLTLFPAMLIPLFFMPIPFSALIIAGGILCVTSSKEKQYNKNIQDQLKAKLREVIISFFEENEGKAFTISALTNRFDTSFKGLENLNAKIIIIVNILVQEHTIQWEKKNNEYYYTYIKY